MPLRGRRARTRGAQDSAAVSHDTRHTDTAPHDPHTPYRRHARHRLGSPQSGSRTAHQARTASRTALGTAPQQTTQAPRQAPGQARPRAPLAAPLAAPLPVPPCAAASHAARRRQKRHRPQRSPRRKHHHQPAVRSDRRDRIGSDRRVASTHCAPSGQIGRGAAPPHKVAAPNIAKVVRPLQERLERNALQATSTRAVVNTHAPTALLLMRASTSVNLCQSPSTSVQSPLIADGTSPRARLNLGGRRLLGRLLGGRCLLVRRRLHSRARHGARAVSGGRDGRRIEERGSGGGG